MRTRLLRVALLVLWLLPRSTTKNRALSRLGHPVHDSAIARTNVVWDVDRVELGSEARMNRFNILRHLALVRVGDHGSIGRFNAISAIPAFRRYRSDGGALVLEDHASLTSRHKLDCTALVRLGAFSMVAGNGTSIMTHALDLGRDAQDATSVSIGKSSFVGTRCVILGGGALPPTSVLGAGAVLVKDYANGEPGLYAGVPARRVADVSGDWFTRTSTATRRLVSRHGRGTTVIEDAW